MIDIESYLQRPDSVDKYVHAALALFPDRVDFHMSKGHVMSYSKQYDKALDAYRESLDYAATDSLRSVIWGMIGDTWHQKGIEGREDWDERMDLGIAEPDAAFRKYMKQCYKAYDRSLRYDPDNTMALNNYAYFLSIEGRDLERALSMASRVTALEDDNPTYLDTYAWVLYKIWGARTRPRKSSSGPWCSTDSARRPCWPITGTFCTPSASGSWPKSIGGRRSKRAIRPSLIEPRMQQAANPEPEAKKR